MPVIRKKKTELARGFHFQPYKLIYRDFIMQDRPNTPVELFQGFLP